MSSSEKDDLETRPRLRALDLREEASPRARQQTLLRRVGERWFEMLEAARFGAALVGVDGVILHATPALCGLLGRDEKGLVGSAWETLIRDTDRSSLDEQVRRSLSGSEPSIEAEVRVVHADGGDRWVAIDGGLVRDGRGRPLGFVYEIHDIGARKLEELGMKRVAEELREAEEQKSRFVAEASHELRSPLTSILGFAKTMSRYWDKLGDPEKKDYVGLIAEQGERLSRLIDDLLTLSRIDGGTIRMQSEELSVGDELTRVVSPMPCAEEIRITGAVDASVMVDPDHLSQIVTNFVTNAFKYGAPPVTIEVRDESDFVEILVRDLGEGVTPEFVPLLFDSFTRDKGDELKAGGTGLGLSIVHGLARTHGGEVWYEPNYPQGACFGLRLPAGAQ